MNLFELFVKLSLDDDDFQSGVSKTKSSFEGFSSWTIAKAQLMADAIKSVSKQVINIGKTALDAYGEYEQMVGGAQLMFGDAYETVAQNAKEAYRTVQMSQNDYLRRVNSFAVGLKTSLGGDEQAAAELAHNIIRAQADVVAATGNSAEMVANAFSGIMRGQYNMLDNLGLGINATKEGMQEVIDKVNEWNATQGKATNYTMDNLADQQQALVDYVEMVGMAGYANAEALGTIQGSAGSVKAAWQNLLTNLGNKEANLQELMEELISSVSAVAGNILPIVGNILESMGQLLQDNGPMLLEKGMQLLSEFILGLVEKAPEIYEWIKTMVVTMGSTLLENAPQLIGSILALIGVIIGEVAQALLDFGGWILTKIWEGLLGAVTTFWTNITTKFEEFKEELGKKFDELVKSAKTWGSDMIGGFIDGITQKAEDLWKKVTEVADGITSKLHFSRPDEGPLRDYETWMPDFMKGLANGIEKNKHLVIDQVSQLAEEMNIGDMTANATVKYGSGESNKRSGVSVVQNIYSTAKTAADLMEEAMYQQRKAVLTGV